MTANEHDEFGQEASSKPFLDPIERSSEIIFGLIMALTFTCAVSVATSSRNDITTMLAAALACNIAWGLVDGAMYLLGEIVIRERKRSLAEAMRISPPAEARRLLLDNFPEGSARLLSETALDSIVKNISSLPLAPRTMTPTRDDLRAAVSIFFLVFLSTLPVVIPFVLFQDVGQALRISNAIAVGLLFLIGTKLGRYMNWPSPWVIGLAVACFGAVLVAITIALGG